MTFVPDLYLSKSEVFLSRPPQVNPQTLKADFLFLAVYPYPFYGFCQTPVTSEADPSLWTLPSGHHWGLCPPCRLRLPSQAKGEPYFP